MKIGLDIQSIQGSKTGIGYYTESLIDFYKKNPSDNDFYYYKWPSEKDLNVLERIKWENISLPHYAKSDKIDILHIPGFAGPAGKRSYKKVTTVHDLIGIIFPQNLSSLSRFYWQKWLPFCVKNSDFIIADSENTKKDIINLLKFDASNIEVIHLAADEKFKKTDDVESLKKSLDKYGIKEKYILTVGTIEPRKNISRLIKVFHKFITKNKISDLKLVVVGKKAWDFKKCFNTVSNLAITDKVIFCDYIKDEDMPAFYNMCEMFIYPSLYEGFGLPVLEAMQSGCCALCSNASSIPEVGANAIGYFDPLNENSMLSKIEKYYFDDNLKNGLRESAYKRSEDFNWEKTAIKTMEIYKRVVG